VRPIAHISDVIHLVWKHLHLDTALSLQAIDEKIMQAGVGMFGRALPQGAAPARTRDIPYGAPYKWVYDKSIHIHTKFFFPSAVTYPAVLHAMKVTQPEACIT
jgi:hypothetical protein